MYGQLKEDWKQAGLFYCRRDILCPIVNKELPARNVLLFLFISPLSVTWHDDSFFFFFLNSKHSVSRNLTVIGHFFLPFAFGSFTCINNTEISFCRNLFINLSLLNVSCKSRRQVQTQSAGGIYTILSHPSQACQFTASTNDRFIFTYSKKYICSSCLWRVTFIGLFSTLWSTV